MRTIQAQPNQEEHCVSNNYCFQPDICAYIFTFQTSGDGQCPAVEQAVSKVDDIEADLELLHERYVDIAREFSVVNSEKTNTQQLIQQLNDVINDLEDRVDAVEDDSVSNYISSVNDKLRKLQQEVEDKDSQIRQLQNDVINALENRVEALEDDTDLCKQGLEEKDSQIRQLREDLANLNKSEDCDIGWLKHKDGCYFISLSQMHSFDEARSQCHSVNSELLIINDVQENDFIKNIFEQRGFYSVHIGMKNQLSNIFFALLFSAELSWLDGSTISYSDWDSDKRNKWDPKSCVGMKAASYGKWYYHPCSDKLGFICEKHKPFSVFTTKKSHSNAIETCKGLGMILAMDNNDRKHQILKDLIEESNTTNNEDFWVNGKFTDQGNVATCDGGILYYSKWAPNEPTVMISI
ncbi:C-type lectin domain family 10 member A-like [Ptychodera flava]|uniref:C-type lectin domain family 10 member A-like n=1 Tax=Ptychodera flava TaxID=63121 RepID=UPI00396A64F7